jgi:hypothetical protein
MTSSVLIAARVSPQTKGRLAALANAQQLTESAFLKRLVESAFQVMSPPSSEVIVPVQPRDRSARLYVRLRDDDRFLLRERAAARGMPAATYASEADALLTALAGSQKQKEQKCGISSTDQVENLLCTYPRECRRLAAIH